MITPSKLKKLYKNGKHIESYLKAESKLVHNSEEIIELSYDMQSGSYIEFMKNNEWSKYVEESTGYVVSRILSLCDPKSILEAGIGEGTTFSSMIRNMGNRDVNSYGFDLSWSRIAFAKKWLSQEKIEYNQLCTGSLFNIPFLDNSIDVVYTSHAVEPNGGREAAILESLYRVAKKYVVLMEPGYEFASDNAKKRMDSLGYCKSLNNIAISLGYNVIVHELLPMVFDIKNPTALTIIKKVIVDNESNESILACPKYSVPLSSISGALFSSEALSVYPIIGDIPCLRVKDAILASSFLEFFQE